MRLLLAAGGTGGHVFPALAVAKHLRGILPQSEILFVGTGRGMEREWVTQAGFAFTLLPTKGLNRVGLVRAMSSAVRLPLAFWQAGKILRRFSPEVVFGIGGYASGPLLLLAALMGKKTAILEPNAVAGLANRMLSRWVHKVFLAFAEAKSSLPARGIVVTGNPLRPELLTVSPPDFRQEPKAILVFGGSQGARQLNQAMIDALPQWRQKEFNFRFIHQTGPTDVDRVRASYQEHGFDADVRAFIDNMADAYRESHLVIARAGSSVLEIAACGRPSILVPYPSSADDHQRINAQILTDAGAAVSIDNEQCTGAIMAPLVAEILASSERMQRMSQAALQFRRGNAAEAIVEQLRSFCGDSEVKGAVA